jgi:hypothetical protein
MKRRDNDFLRDAERPRDKIRIASVAFGSAAKLSSPGFDPKIRRSEDPKAGKVPITH